MTKTEIKQLYKSLLKEDMKNSKEMIVIIHDDQDYYLKRLYV